MDETREIDIDLRKIVYMMRTKVIFIFLITIVFGCAAGIYTHFFIDPVYSASISMCVYSNPDRVTTDQAISQGELNAARDLTGTYSYILKSDLVLDKVAEELNYPSGASIKGYISTSSIENTFVLRVIVSCKDPQLATDIANTIAKIAPDEMIKAVKAGGVSIIDTAKVPRSPSSPNTKKNILIGLAIGFALSFIGFFIYEMFDTTITNAKDLERDFEIPVLGTVPMLEAVEDKETSGDNDEVLDLTAPKPSNTLLENLQSMKGDAKND